MAEAGGHEVGGLGRAPLLAVPILALLTLGLVAAPRVARSSPGATPTAAWADPAPAVVGRALVAPPLTTPVTPQASGPAPGRPLAPVATGPLDLPLPGCPVPPPPVDTTTGPGWVPPVLVPEDELPEPVPAPDVVSADLGPVEGKGMWVWKFGQTEGGDAAAVIERARTAGLRQLWVRVGDSRSGFYAADVLSALVPRAHQAGLAVVGWGFPFLHDPVDDARWSAEALAWRGPGGVALDGFSPDIEMATEGVVLTERRARVYLGLVRQAAGERLVVATVYRPTDRLWTGSYPYTAIASYVDAFAPMVYWGCAEPGAATAEALDRLSRLRPVHVIGQGYDAGADGGRPGAPSAGETVRFLDVAQRDGAIGASFWVWQSIDDEQWEAMSSFPWYPGDAGG
ncbi:MAG: hypothetical protein QOI56_114 [Actinomycetota bacterium]|nr:hypothetical protein [Actinomycetota bacterium]